jgi:hypothetical protein
MRELVPLTNELAALMMITAMSGFGGDDAILPHAPASLPMAAGGSSIAKAQAKAASEAATGEAVAAPAAKSSAQANAASPAKSRSRERASARWLRPAV